MKEFVEKVKKVVKELTPAQLITAAKKVLKNSFKTELTKSCSIDEIVAWRKKYGGTMEVSIDELFSSKLKEIIMIFFAEGQKPLAIIAFLKDKGYGLCDSSVYNYETEFKAMNLSA